MQRVSNFVELLCKLFSISNIRKLYFSVKVILIYAQSQTLANVKKTSLTKNVDNFQMRNIIILPANLVNKERHTLPAQIVWISLISYFRNHLYLFLKWR